MKCPRILILTLLAVLASGACLPFSLATRTPRPPLVFDPATLPDGQAGIAYDVEVAVSQNVTPVYQFFLIDETTLPPGLELVYVENEARVRIAGTPTQAGTYTFRLGAACLGWEPA